MARGVLVLDGSLAGLEPHLRKNNFHIINLPVGTMDAERKAMFLSHRTLITKTPKEFKYDVPVLEYSIIDVSALTVDDTTLADIISRAWTRLRLKSEGYFILHLRRDGNHTMEFPE
jgi:hypothetical protein